MSDEVPLLPGMPAPKAEAWREHTAERFLRDDPEGYARCIQLIREGETNKSRLADLFGRSRNTITALMMREFSVEQLTQLTAKRAAILTLDALDRQDEIVPEAGKRELGALSMAGKAAFEIKQLASGGPTEIRETRNVTLTVDDLQRFLAGEPAPVAAQEREIDATEAGQELEGAETGFGGGSGRALPRVGGRVPVDLDAGAGAGGDTASADDMSAGLVTLVQGNAGEMLECNRERHHADPAEAGNFQGSGTPGADADRGRGGVADAAAPSRSR